jgi:hypothetical protein
MKIYLIIILIFYIQIIGCGVLYDEFSEYLKIQRNDSIDKLTCIRMIDIFNQLIVLNSYDEYYLKAWQIYRYFVTEGMYICICCVIFYWLYIYLLFDFILYFCHLGWSIWSIDILTFFVCDICLSKHHHQTYRCSLHNTNK